MKGIISIIELIIVAVVLLTAFGILFRSQPYTNRWAEANVLLKSRDLLNTLDKTGNLYQYTFTTDDVPKFISSVLPESSLFSWIEESGAIKNESETSKKNNNF